MYAVDRVLLNTFYMTKYINLFYVKYTKFLFYAFSFNEAAC